MASMRSEAAILLSILQKKEKKFTQGLGLKNSQHGTLVSLVFSIFDNSRKNNFSEFQQSTGFEPVSPDSLQLVLTMSHKFISIYQKIGIGLIMFCNLKTFLACRVFNVRLLKLPEMLSANTLWIHITALDIERICNIFSWHNFC